MNSTERHVVYQLLAALEATMLELALDLKLANGSSMRAVEIHRVLNNANTALTAYDEWDAA